MYFWKNVQETNHSGYLWGERLGGCGQGSARIILLCTLLNFLIFEQGTWFTYSKT